MDSRYLLSQGIFLCLGANEACRFNIVLNSLLCPQVFKFQRRQAIWEQRTRRISKYSVGRCVVQCSSMEACFAIWKSIPLCLLVSTTTLFFGHIVYSFVLGWLSGIYAEICSFWGGLHFDTVIQINMQNIQLHSWGNYSKVVMPLYIVKVFFLWKGG